MANSKCRYKDQYLFPVFKQVNSSESRNETNMIECGFVNDVIPPDLKIKDKIIHAHLHSDFDRKLPTL